VALTFPTARSHVLVDDDLAERVLRRFLTWCDDERNQKRAYGMVMGALRQRSGARLTLKFLNNVILRPVLVASGSHPSAARMELVAGQLMALAMVRYRIRLEPIASMDAEELIALYAPAVRAMLTGEEQVPTVRVVAAPTERFGPVTPQTCKLTGRLAP
jgi:Tetracyclin repressor-like, C-terminal domain